MKIVLNSKAGGFGLSKEAYEALGKEWDGYGYAYEKDRTNAALVHIVEELGKKANGSCAHLKVIEIPDGIEYVINECDGMETVYEVGHIWF